MFQRILYISSTLANDKLVSVVSKVSQLDYLNISLHIYTFLCKLAFLYVKAHLTGGIKYRNNEQTIFC